MDITKSSERGGWTEITIPDRARLLGSTLNSALCLRGSVRGRLLCVGGNVAGLCCGVVCDLGCVLLCSGNDASGLVDDVSGRGSSLVQQSTSLLARLLGLMMSRKKTRIVSD